LASGAIFDPLLNAVHDHLDDTLRSDKYQGNPNPMTGHCYVASETMYHLLGGANGEWVPQFLRHEGEPHWWLKNKINGKILDPTASQFQTPVPYELGVGKGFLTAQPSKRSVELMERMRMQPKLSKGLGRTIGLTAALASGAMAPAQADPSTVSTIQRVATPPEPAQWHTKGLHPDLYPIAHLETSFGKNMHHPFFKDAYNTAHSAVGLKPVTAHEEYRRSPTLQRMYGEFKDPYEFTKKFKNDPEFYNLCATAHFLHLKNKHQSTLRAVYAWRHGTGAATKASEADIVNDPYVQKYSELSIATGVKPGQASLAKSVGYVTLPHFDRDPLHNPGAYYPSPEYYKKLDARRSNKLLPKSGGFAGSNLNRAKILVEPEGDVIERGSRRLNWQSPPFAPGQPVPPPRLPDSEPSLQDKELADLPPSATPMDAKRVMWGRTKASKEGHEVQHGIFGRLANKPKVIKALLESLPSAELNHVRKLFSIKSAKYAPAKHPEETITYLRSYLTDPVHREDAHRQLGIELPRDQHESMARAKNAWKYLQDAASKMTPENLQSFYRIPVFDPVTKKQTGEQIRADHPMAAHPLNASTPKLPVRR
jgi:hypothetical protein